MKRIYILLVLLFISSLICKAQVGIGNTNPKATLDVSASNAATPAITDGMLIPRVSAFPTTNPGADQNGMLVFLTTDNKFYYWKHSVTSWVALTGTGAEKIDDLSDGKSDSSGSSIFLGVNSGAVDDGDNNNLGMGQSSLLKNTEGSNNYAIGYNALVNNVNGNHNLAIGYGALYHNVAGSNSIAIGNYSMVNSNNSTSSISKNNIAIGYRSLEGSLTPSNNTGVENIAIGSYALMGNSTGYSNVANGHYALNSNTEGDSNTAIGDSSLVLNTIGSGNVAIGSSTLSTNVAGSRSIAIGDEAMLLANNSSTPFYSDNVAVGYQALRGSLGISANNTGTKNTALGSGSLSYNSSGSNNVALGSSSLYFNEKGNDNVAIGVYTLSYNKAGSQITAIGNGAMYNANNSTSVFNSNNVALGYQALYGSTTQSANTGVNNNALGAVSMYYNSSGSNNSTNGYASLYRNTTGNKNIAIGIGSLSFNTTGNNNSALGSDSGDNLTAGNNNIIIGGNSIDFPSSTESNQLNIGNMIYGTSIDGTANTVSTGKIGIGVKIPAEKFEINGALKLGTTTGTNAGTLRWTGTDFEGYNGSSWESFSSGWNESGNTGTNPSTNFMGTTDNVDIVFRTNNLERMRLTTNGNLQLKTTATNAILFKNDENYNHTADNSLDFGDPNDAWMIASREGIGETAGIYGDSDFVTVWAPADSNRMIRFLDEDQWSDDDGNPYNNTAEIAYVDNNGLFVQASDRNRKQNIQKIKNSIEKINKINGYTYEYKVSSFEKQKGEMPSKSSGVIAQELYEVIPEAVQISENGEYFVHYAGIIPLLIEALKEQHKEINELKEKVSKLEDLEARIKVLEQKYN